MRLYSHHDWVVEPQRAKASFAELQAEVPALAGVHFDQQILSDEDEDEKSEEFESYEQVEELGFLGLAE